MACEVRERAVAGQRGGVRVVVGAVVAVEAVAGALIDVDRDVGVGGLDLVHVGHRDARVLGAEVEHRRAVGRLADELDDLAAVIADRHVELQTARGKPGERSAPAIAHDPHLGRALERVDAGLDVHDRTVPADIGLERAALVDRLGGVAPLDSRLLAVEQAGRQHEVALGRVVVAHASDVVVDPENLLHEHEARARLAIGRSAICVENVTIVRGQPDSCAHRGSLPDTPLSGAYPRAGTSHSRRGIAAPLVAAHCQATH